MAFISSLNIPIEIAGDCLFWFVNVKKAVWLTSGVLVLLTSYTSFITYAISLLLCGKLPYTKVATIRIVLVLEC